MSNEGCTLLAGQNCVPCKGGVPPLEGDEPAALHADLGHGWDLVEDHHLEKAYSFPDFKEALAFTNTVGGIAEEQDHHPDIVLSYGRVQVTIWTHKINGLTESDFVFAAKVEQAYQHAV